jgi:hypothetical protein
MGLPPDFYLSYLIWAGIATGFSWGFLIAGRFYHCCSSPEVRAEKINYFLKSYQDNVRSNIPVAQAVSAAARMRLTTSGIKTQQKHTASTTSSSTTEEFMQKVGSTYHSSNLLPPLIKIGGILPSSSSSHAFKAR